MQGSQKFCRNSYVGTCRHNAITRRCPSLQPSPRKAGRGRSLTKVYNDFYDTLQKGERNVYKTDRLWTGANYIGASS